MGSEQDTFQRIPDAPASANDGVSESNFGAPVESNFGNPAALYQQGLRSGVFRG